MPYISPTDQDRLMELTSEIAGTSINTAGELNFLITHLIVRYMAVHEHRYQTMNDVVGALAGAQAEFTRRVVIPYEQQKLYDLPADMDPYNVHD